MLGYSSRMAIQNQAGSCYFFIQMLSLPQRSSHAGACMRTLIPICAAAVVSTCGFGASAEDIHFPQVIQAHYEATDAKVGGQFVMWSERERIFYGLDSKLFPGTRTVDVTQITPAPGSFALTYVEIKTVTGQVPEYLYLAGNVRFRISGMVLKSSNFPAGFGMAPQP
jgi:hypothetical protein